MTGRPALPRVFLDRAIAHRGLHDRSAGRIENSRAAAVAAIEAGYAIELDLQLSADGEAIVFHDDRLDRLTAAAGPVIDRTADELARISLSGARETIPTFSDFLALVAGRAPLLVEIKDQGGRYDETGVGPLEARTAELLSSYDGSVAVMSFNPAAVAAFAQRAPRIARGLTAQAARLYPASIAPERRAALAALAGYAVAGCSFVSYDHAALPTPETARLRAEGDAVLAWTIKSPKAEAAALRHCDAVTFEGYRPAH